MAYDLTRIESLLIADNADEQSKAIKALTTMEDKETFLFMLNTVPKVDEPVKNKLLNLIHGVKQSHKLPTLIEYLSADPPPEHGETIIEFFKSKEIIKYYRNLLAEAVEDKDHPETLLEMITFMTFIGDVNSCETFNSLVSQGEETVKIAALNSLHSLEYPKISNTLLIAYKREDGDVALKVIDILKQRNMAKESVSLVHSLMDKNPEVQEATVEFMGSANRSELKKFLGEALKNEKDEFKERVLELFEKYGVPDLASDIKEASLDDEKKIRREETLLIISNVFLSRLTLSKILAPIYNISEAQDGHQALTTMKSTEIDLVIADKNLPNMKIDELVKTVRKVSASIPIVIFFSNLSDSEKEEVRRFGINYFLIKPFHKEEALSIIDQALSSTKKSTKMDRYLKTYTKGETIFREGDQGDSCYLLQQGRIRILKERRGAKPLVLAELAPGDLLGEMSLISNAPRSATAIAVTDSIVIVVGRNNFDTMVHQSPEFAKKLIIICSERIRKLSNQVKSLYGGYDKIQRMIKNIVSGG